jgi:DNA/RNA-binding domain of Phe-tRNA-synthetase-like protein
MTEPDALQAFLDGAAVAPEVFVRHPDYRALLLAVEGLAPPGPGEDAGAAEVEALLRAAEAGARVAIGDGRVEDLPQVASWRAAYRGFGAKPQRTRNSLEALLRRVAGGLPRVNTLTDVYNAISVKHLLPIGGEDMHRYQGSPRLIRATGCEPFDTVAAGAVAVEYPEPGEVIWCDDAGVTCRRWNWRQARRTRLGDDTTAALFILDALDPLTDAHLQAATDDLAEQLAALGPAVRTARRVLAAPGTGAAAVQETGGGAT